MSALLEKKANFTVKLILDAACELVKELDIDDISFKKVSEKADISQRTMFRYYNTRDAFLDALTVRLYQELVLPGIPDNVDGFDSYIKELYEKLEADPRKVMVLLSKDLLPRVLDTTAKQRLASIKELLSRTYPTLSTREITKSAANMRYVMSASSWRYYRMHFEFDLRTATECAQQMVQQTLRHLEELSVK